MINKKNALYPQKAWIFSAVLLLVLAWAGSSRGESLPYLDSDSGFSVTIPDVMSIVPKQQLRSQIEAPVTLFLRHRSGNKYPTLNVLMLPGEYELSSRSDGHIEREIIKSYQLVGITDVAPLSRSRTAPPLHPRFDLELTYSNQSQKLRSVVSYISAKDRHFIVTYVDRAQHFDTYRPHWLVFMNSFKPLGTDSIAVKPENKPHSWISGLILLSACGLILGLIMWVRRSWNSSERKS